MAAARDYHGRVVVVTGAAGGLGAALCRHFAAAGARVAALDLDGARAAALAEALGGSGAGAGVDARVDAIGLACDVADAAAVGAAMAAVQARWGGIDVLVNNAGISARCLLRDAGATVLPRVMAVNFFGSAHCTEAALASLTARRGQIIVISSIAGFSPLVGRTAYAASKHALHGYFDSLRSELLAQGVDVMLVCPSFVATGIEAAALGGDGRPADAARQTGGEAATPDAVAARIVAAARKRRRLCLPATTARLAWWLTRLAPRSYERLMLARVGAEFETSRRSPA